MFGRVLNTPLYYLQHYIGKYLQSLRGGVHNLQHFLSLVPNDPDKEQLEQHQYKEQGHVLVLNQQYHNNLQGF